MLLISLGFWICLLPVITYYVINPNEFQKAGALLLNEKLPMIRRKETNKIRQCSSCPGPDVDASGPFAIGPSLWPLRFIITSLGIHSSHWSTP